MHTLVKIIVFFIVIAGFFTSSGETTKTDEDEPKNLDEDNVFDKNID